MSIFKTEREIKRMIFNVYADLAERLEEVKAEARRMDKRLDVDTAVNKALDKFVKKAEKKMDELRRETKDKPRIHTQPDADSAPEAHPGQDPELPNGPQTAV